MRAIRLTTTDPAFNLAFEEHLFRSMLPQSEPYLLLWQNASSVIVGRHQNTQAEVNNDYVQAQGIPVLRRITGGGAVYHDLGNLNFSFLMPRKTLAVDSRTMPDDATLNFRYFLQPIVRALDTLGVHAEFSSRNDLTVNGAKISGSAQFRHAGGFLHHGTLLFALDMDMLSKVLRGSPEKYISKGLHSVRSRVVNLQEFLQQGTEIETLAHVLAEQCAAVCSEPDAADLKAAAALADSKYRQWSWNYGASPVFTECREQRFPWGRVECCYTVRAGLITECRFYGDFFAGEDISTLEQAFCGLPREKNALLAAVRALPLERFFAGCDLVQLGAFLTTAA